MRCCNLGWVLTQTMQFPDQELCAIGCCTVVSFYLGSWFLGSGEVWRGLWCGYVFLDVVFSMPFLQLKFVKVWSHKLLLLIIYIRENSLFDTPKTANSFLGPRKLNIPYLTLQTFHSQYDIPSKSVSMHYISVQDYTSTSYIYTQGFQNILNFLFMLFL